MTCRDVRLRPSDEEHVVVLQPALTISGTVSDAKTGMPVPKFQIVCGWPETIDNEQRVRLIPSDRFNLIDRFRRTFFGGTFRYTMEEPLIIGIPNPGYVFKFEADGYAPFLTRVFTPDEGEVEFAVALEPAVPVTVTVLQPDGAPAAQCDVGFLLPGTSLSLLPSSSNRKRPDSSFLTTDAAGRFELPVDSSVTKVVAFHSQGFATGPATGLKV